MINYERNNLFTAFKKVLQNLRIAIIDFLNMDDNDDHKPNKAQLLAQRVDGKKVPVNRKL